jgi:hypothetical protein
MERLPCQLCFWSGAFILFAWAAWSRFALPLDPIADPDTWGYLSPALRKLTGAEFGHTNGRNFIYPGFLYLVLRVFRDFRAITVVQHFFGLLAGGILVLTWRRARVFVLDPRVGYAVHTGLGLVAATIFLLASDPIRFEMQLRPEGVCAFLISVNLYFVIQFTACFFVERRQASSVAYGVAAVFSAILLASAKPSFWLASIVVLLPVAMFFVQRGLIWQKIALGGGAALSAALLLLPEHFLARNDPASQTFLPTTLFVIHANLIRDQMADDLTRGAKVPYPREWLGHVQRALSDEIAKSLAVRSGIYSTLGFDPDYLMYDRSSIAARLRREFGGNIPALCAFYRFYYWRIWRQRPLVVLKKIGRQMAIFYAPLCPAYNYGKSLSVTDAHNRGVISLDIQSRRQIWAAYLPAADFMSRAKSVPPRVAVIHQPRYVRLALSVMAVTHLPLLLIAAALGTVVLTQERHRRRLGWLAALVLLGYLCNAAACLEVAVIHSLEIRRYITVQMFLTLFVQFLALWFILEFALEMRVRAKSSFPEASDAKDINRCALSQGRRGRNWAAPDSLFRWPTLIGWIDDYLDGADRSGKLRTQVEQLVSADRLQPLGFYGFGTWIGRWLG